MQTVNRNGALILASGVLMIGVGLVVFLVGPVGSPKFVTINSRTVPIYDLTRPFLGMGVALGGAGIVMSTVLVGNPLIHLYGRFTHDLRFLVSGIDDPVSLSTAKMLFAAFGIMVGFSLLVPILLWYELGPIPSALEPLIIDALIRFGFFIFYMVLMFLSAFFIVSSCLGSVIAGLITRATRRIGTAETSRLEDLSTHLMLKQFRSKGALVAYALAAFLAWLAFILPTLQVPLILAACSIWAFSFGKSAFMGFYNASRVLGLRPRSAFKSVKIRNLLAYGIGAWELIVFIIVWRALFVLTLEPSLHFIFDQAPISTLVSSTSLKSLFLRLTSTILQAMSEAVSNYWIFVLFMLATTGILYAFVFPEYFMRKSNRIFARKIILAVVVFGVSLISQIAITYFAPSSPSILYSSMIFLVTVIIVEFLQRSYEEAMELPGN